MSIREDRERPAYPGWIKLLEEKTLELKEFFKKRDDKNGVMR